MKTRCRSIYYKPLCLLYSKQTCLWRLPFSRSHSPDEVSHLRGRIHDTNVYDCWKLKKPRPSVECIPLMLVWSDLTVLSHHRANSSLYAATWTSFCKPYTATIAYHSSYTLYAATWTSFCKPYTATIAYHSSYTQKRLSLPSTLMFWGLFVYYCNNLHQTSVP